MTEYTVTLTQKVKAVLEAETPQAALERAKTEATTADRRFEPTQFSVKES
jgi:hypothetical protein